MTGTIKSLALAISFTATALTLAPAAFAQDATGAWKTGKANVRIADCGGALCANVVSLNEPNDPDTGKAKLDKHNSDASKKARPIVGISLLSGMKAAEAGVWKGSVYNPEDGKTYAASMTLKGSSLTVEGCAMRVFCKTQVWNR